MTGVTKVLVVGDGPVAEAITPMLAALGWEATVSAGTAPVSGHDVVVVLSHHEDVDGPMIRDALAAGTAYVGAMGSRRTQARRREWLLAHGVDERALAALRAPIGLGIGADSPGEIAVSILAEVVAVRRGVAAAGGVGALSARDGAIHPDLAPGEAECPGG
ncbi:MAG: XdhC family protein [Nocardioides sp.]